jgi:small subunit ribosomal protein S20
LRLTSAPPLPTLRGPKTAVFQGGDGKNVANTKSAEKAARQAVKHRISNVASRSRLRTAIRKATEAVASGNKETASAGIREAQPVIDAMVNKGLIHRNKAARHKSRLAAKARVAAGK